MMTMTVMVVTTLDGGGGGGGDADDVRGIVCQRCAILSDESFRIINEGSGRTSELTVWNR